MIITKLSRTFTEWSNINHFPPYMKKAKIICLSKEATALPSAGQVRTIAVLPVVSKVFEKLLLSKLKEEITAKGGHNKYQRGF